MMRSLAMWIGLRYTRAKRRNHFISFISLVSMLGIVIGVTALITVISVMNGFESELRTRILGMVSHATISAADDQTGMDDWQKAIDLSGTDPRVLGAAPYAEREGLAYRVDEPKQPVRRQISYAENFRYDRKTPWTH